MSVFKRRRSEDGDPLAEPGSSAFAAASDTRDAVAEKADDLSVPPFRPVPAKEASTMARTPFAASPSSLQPQPGRSLVLGRGAQRDAAERRTLVVGHGISVQGTVQDAEKLVVEGTVEATMIRATELSIAPGGVFKGEVEVEDAEIAGTIDGTLTVHGNMSVKASGKVLGTARYGRLQVEDGGQITGHMEMLEARSGDSRVVPHEVSRPEAVRAPSESAA